MAQALRAVQTLSLLARQPMPQEGRDAMLLDMAQVSPPMTVYLKVLFLLSPLNMEQQQEIFLLLVVGE